MGLAQSKNDPIANFFASQLDSFSQGQVKGGFDLQNSLLNGVTGNGWDFSKVGEDADKWATGIRDSYTGQTSSLFTNGKDGPKTDPQQDLLKNLNDPNQFFNSKNWKSYTQNINNAHYSPQAGMGNTTPPSDLMKISDPMTKIKQANLRGSFKNVHSGISSAMNVNSSSSFQPALANGSSQVINSGGGGGTDTSIDIRNGTATNITNG